MGKIVTVLLFLLPLDSFAYDCTNANFLKNNPIFCFMKSLQPSLNNNEAMKLSNYLYKYSKKYKMNPMISVGILFAETSITNKDKIKWGYVFYKDCDSCEYKYKKVKVHTDIGYFQFHVGTIEYYNLDPVKLKFDMEYNVEAHFKLLKIKMKLCRNKKHPWACWHSKTNSLNKKYANRILGVLE